MISRSLRLALLLPALIAPVCLSQEGGVDYRDYRKHLVHFPLGDRSFADEVVSFKIGDPAPKASNARDPEEALGPPNYNDKARANAVTLGCGGALVLRFTDNAVIDVPGPDLFVFEVGPSIEPTRLEISRDGEKWIDVGKISGGTAEIDIAGKVQPGDSFNYVRLTDLQEDCSGRWPGADIDAVGAIGGVLHISLQSSVLFDFNQSTLKDAAKQALHEAATAIRSVPGATVRIEGHTDNVGADAVNRPLSLARANAVRDHLHKVEGVGGAMETRGYAASRPVASNDTDEGREKNRRVEILVVPK